MAGIKTSSRNDSPKQLIQLASLPSKEDDGKSNSFSVVMKATLQNNGKEKPRTPHALKSTKLYCQTWQILKIQRSTWYFISFWHIIIVSRKTATLCYRYATETERFLNASNQRIVCFRSHMLDGLESVPIWNKVVVIVPCCWFAVITYTLFL